MPHVAIIVGGVLITVGAAVAIHQFAWPHIQPKAEELADNIKAHWEEFQRKRKGPMSERPHQQGDKKSPSRKSSASSSRSPDPFSDAFIRDSDLASDTRIGGSGLIMSEPEGVVKSQIGTQSTITGLRRRQNGGNTEEHEMFEISHPIPTVTYSLMNLTPPSNNKPLIDDYPNPFLDSHSPLDNDDVANAEQQPSLIPLPKSASSSVVQDSSQSAIASSTDKIGTVRSAHSGSSKQTSPSLDSFATAITQQLRERSISPINHTNAEIPAPQPIHLHPNIQAQRSPVQSSTLSSPRATSPSALSDTPSMVSAAPSRTWTDGGTADIFSGSDHDFHSNASDEEDVRSVSSSGSWEDLDARVSSPSFSAAGRPTR